RTVVDLEGRTPESIATREIFKLARPVVRGRQRGRARHVPLEPHPGNGIRIRHDENRAGRTAYERCRNTTEEQSLDGTEPASSGDDEVGRELARHLEHELLRRAFANDRRKREA